MKHYLLTWVCTFALFFNVQAQLKYPQTRKVDQTDEYFGTKVADPYRWLEDDRSAETEAWVKAQNEVTFSYLEKIPFREQLKKRLTALANYPKYSSPYRIGEYYFFSKNDGLQNQSVVYYQKGIDSSPEVFLDPNKLSTDGTVRAGLIGFSNDKKYAAFSISKSGSDWNDIQVMDIATRKVFQDKLEWVKFSGAAWYKDGFFYSRYDKPEEGKEFSKQNQFHRVYYHVLGKSQLEDELVYEDKQNPLRYHFAQTTEDDRFLILNISQGTDGSEIHYRNLAKGDKSFKLLFKGFDYNYSVIDNIDDKLLVLTNYKAPNYRLILVDTQNPEEKNWKELIAEKTELLEGVGTAGGKIFATYLKDATSKVYQFDLTGKLDKEIILPAIGTAGGFGGNKDDKFIFYTFTSFNYPPTIFKYDIATGKSEIFRKTEVPFTPSDFEVKQVFYNSKDGTKVPMFLVYKKGLQLNGKNPTYLYAYGGFNVNLTPSFNALRIALLEQGGVFAMANLRGGGEYGEAWHKAGMLLKKQNVFDDFIGAAEYLIKQKYTSKNHLAIAGGSNGGLLVGACMAQRPDLYKVAFPAVGVMDMLRFHKFTVGWGWVVEYGSSERSKEEFENLLKYSPLHNLKKGIEYPATLVTTADHDDRVVPAHSFKFAAQLQEAHVGKNPVLIRIETKSGHGSSSLTKAIEETADVYSFMFYNMGVTPVFK